MEKLKFTIRFVVLLAAVPAIMLTELTRKDKKIDTDKQQRIEKANEATNAQVVLNHSPFMQAAYN